MDYAPFDSGSQVYDRKERWGTNKNGQHYKYAETKNGNVVITSGMGGSLTGRKLKPRHQVENDKAHRAARLEMSDKEKKSAWRYSTAERDSRNGIALHAELNGRLRSNQPIPEGLREDYQVLHKMLDRAKTAAPIEVYRGLNTVPDGHEEGKVFLERGFMSTSSNFKISTKGKFMDSDKGALLILKVPPGAHGASIRDVSRFPNQQEILFRDGTHYRIDTVVPIPGKAAKQIYATVLTDKEVEEHYKAHTEDRLTKDADTGLTEITQEMLTKDNTKTEIFAFDTSPSMRSKDSNGFLHVATSHITKAQIADYMGIEIPDYKEFGLEPYKVYYGYRPPEELKKSLSTWNGVPIHRDHHIDGVEIDPTKDMRIGAMGTDAKWNDPYVDNSLTFWDREAIEAIEDGSCKELSCGYSFRPDFTPGEIDGVAYDFIMRDIRANHVALVAKGRAGRDVYVADSASNLDLAAGGGNMEEEKKVAVNTADTDTLKGDAAGMEENKVETTAVQAPAAADEEAAEMTPEMAKAMGDCGFDSEDAELAKVFAAGFKSGAEAGANPEPETQDSELDAKVAEVMAQINNLPEDIRNAIVAKLSVPAAQDEDPEAQAEDNDNEEEKPAAIAQDSARRSVAFDTASVVRQVRAQMTADFKARSAAARDVRPTLGEVDCMAFDSADAIYGAALSKAGYNTGRYAKSSWHAMYDVYKSQQGQAAGTKIAMDSAPTKLEGAFANLGKISIGE